MDVNSFAENGDLRNMNCFFPLSVLDSSGLKVGKSGCSLTRAVIFMMLFVLVMPLEKGIASPIQGSLARTVAQNLLIRLHATNEISSVEPIDYDGTRVAYLVELSPRGYIVVAANNIRVPIKAYSLVSRYADLPAAYITEVLRELQVPAVLPKSSVAPEVVNSSYWNYLEASDKTTLSKDYVPDTHLLTTTWNQDAPYNEFTPLLNGEHTLTGCVQTAEAQILRYHKYPASGSGVFTSNWNGQQLTAILNRPFNWDDMPEDATASPLGYRREEVAALMYDLGVVNRASFGLGGTSAAFDSRSFSKAFGYAPVSGMDISNPDFFSTIRSEIDNLRPVLLSIPNHMTVADGYASDGTGRKIHVNMGWGGAYDDYYYLDQTIDAGGNSFSPNNYIYYNLKPCSGDECQAPYAPLGTMSPPQFVRPLDDMVNRGTTVVRVDARDPDGDPVNLAASSSCPSLALSLDGDILTMKSGASSSYCQVSVFAESADGATATKFNVLSVGQDIYMGQDFSIYGEFLDNSEQHRYHVYLAGDTMISGYRGFSNQAFYIWVEDQSGAMVVAPAAQAISTTLTAGYYTLVTSLRSPSGRYYNYDAEYSDFTIEVQIDSTVAQLAQSMGLSLPLCRLDVMKTGGGGGTVTGQPYPVDCGNSCSQSVVCGAEEMISASPDSTSMFTGWTGTCSGRATTTRAPVDADPSACIANFAADLDQDKMPDDWERQYGLDTSANDALGDADHDGVDNIDEYRNGTPPNIMAGDLDGNDTIDTRDCIIGLRIISGADVSPAQIGADLDGDDRIGMAEVLYDLGKVAVSR